MEKRFKSFTAKIDLSKEILDNEITDLQVIYKENENDHGEDVAMGFLVVEDRLSLTTLTPSKFENIIKPDAPNKLDTIFTQFIVIEDDDIRWASEDDPRTHTAIYARMMDGTTHHIMDFTDKEDAELMLIIFKNLLKVV